MLNSQLATLTKLAIALYLTTGATADCWKGKCNIDGLGTFTCARACRNKGYSASGYETYYKLGSPPRLNTGNQPKVLCAL